MSAIRSLAAAAALLVLGACMHAGNPTPATLAGRFELVSYDGKPLPTPSLGEPEFTVQSGVLVLGARDSAELTMTVQRRGAAGTLMHSVAGRYRVTGDSLVVTMPAGEMRGVANGATLALRTPDGSRTVFRRL